MSDGGGAGVYGPAVPWSSRRPAHVWVAALVALASVLLAACGQEAAAPGSTVVQVDPGNRVPTKGPVDLGTAADEPRGRLDTVSGLLFTAPIYPGDFADPFSLRGPDANYAYATNTASANVPVLRSPDGLEVQYLGDALPQLPPWTAKGFVWAPSVLALSPDRYVLYYTTIDDTSKRQCISRATATTPAGPFADDSAAAMICQLDLGGSIDPSPFVDSDGTPHLLWKSDGDCCKLPTTIWSAPLSADGLSLAGPPVALIGADQPWEGDLVEGPSMVRAGGSYLLFYSANAWNTADYAIGYAECDSVQGPCRKPTTEPWMRSTGRARGPGGQEFFTGEGTGTSSAWMVYHGWLPGQVGPPEGQRRLYLDEIRVEDGRPVRMGSVQIEEDLVATLAPYLLAGAAAVTALVVVVRRRRRRPAPSAPQR
jgi:hypothetical protein